MNLAEKAEQGYVTESDDDYHTSEGINAGKIVDTLVSPAHCKAGGHGPGAKTANEGHVVHAALLEPDRFKHRAVLEPDAPWTKSGKIEWLDFFEEIYNRDLLKILPEECIQLKVADRPSVYKPSVIHVSAKEMEMVAGIKSRIYESDVFTGLLAGIHEQSGYLKTDEEFDNLIIKTRPDVRSPGRERIVDIKTTTDARDFIRNGLINLKYHVKAAWYLDICNAIDVIAADYYEFIWLVIEKTPPFGVMAYKMDIESDEFAEGRKLGLKALTEYRDCTRSGEWPCYDDTIRRAELPAWYKKAG